MYLLIDLYDSSNRILSVSEAKEWKSGIKVSKGAKNVWHGEEHLLIQL